VQPSLGGFVILSVPALHSKYTCWSKLGTRLSATHNQQLHDVSMSPGNGGTCDIQIPFIPCVTCSFYSMSYVRPWRNSNSRNDNFDARRIVADYELEQMRQFQMVPTDDNKYRLSIKAPLRDPRARSILICRVLVPHKYAERANVWQRSPQEPFNINVPASHCCPHLFVHMGY
jgi:hypothetical protein